MASSCCHPVRLRSLCQVVTHGVPVGQRPCATERVVSEATVRKQATTTSRLRRGENMEDLQGERDCRSGARQRHKRYQRTSRLSTQKANTRIAKRGHCPRFIARDDFLTLDSWQTKGKPRTAWLFGMLHPSLCGVHRCNWRNIAISLKSPS